MKSRKANLVIDAAKDIVRQYREQLALAIEENRARDLDEYEYECKVLRAERALSCVDKILKNFELSIFDGIISEDGKNYQAVYTERGRELKELLYKERPSLEETELHFALEGAGRVFKQIGIPKYSMYPLIADLMERFRDENYDRNELQEEWVKDSLKDFNLEGKYNVGDLSINNLLSTQVTLDTEVLIYSNSDPVRYYQGKKLFLENSKIKELVNDYVKKEIDEQNLTTLEGQNNLVHDTFETLRCVGNNGGGVSTDYSLKYYEYFRSVNRGGLGGKEYFNVARAVYRESFEFENNINSLVAMGIDNMDKLINDNLIGGLLSDVIAVFNESGAQKYLVREKYGVESDDFKKISEYHQAHWDLVRDCILDKISKESLVTLYKLYDRMYEVYNNTIGDNARYYSQVAYDMKYYLADMIQKLEEPNTTFTRLDEVVDRLSSRKK